MTSNLRALILSTLEYFYGKQKLELDEKAEQVLSVFQHNAQLLLLQACLNNETKISFFTCIQGGIKKSIVFYKTTTSDIISEDEVDNINIISLSDNPAESLYQTLHKIYSPLLASGDDLFSNKVQTNILELETNLRILAQEEGHGKNVILSIEDEVEYWKALGLKNDVSKKEKEAALIFCELFEDISEEMSVMQSRSLSEVREAVENIGGLLDDIWRSTVAPFAQDRMMHVFDIIGHVICFNIQKSISVFDLWKVYDVFNENEVIRSLNESLTVLQTWLSACKTLTQTYWPNYALHTWNGKPYLPPFCTNFETRFKEIHDIRSVYSQLNKLLTDEERQELKIGNLFEPFQNVNMWICSGPSKEWETAVLSFDLNLRPAELKVAEKLKSRLHTSSTKQMLHEFLRYKTLIDRSVVKRALNNELETFISFLNSMLKTIQNQLDSDEVDVKVYQAPEMSPIVQQIQWAKQMEAKVEDIKSCAEKYLNEFDGSTELSKLSVQLLKDLKTMYTQLYEEWSRDLQALTGSEAQRAREPVLRWASRARLLAVGCGAGLARAAREARALAALGLRAPPAAAAALQRLAARLADARALHQIASFHNTLGERMIQSTRPMMLQAALDFSTLVQDQKVVYWDDKEQLVTYINKLKSAVLKLETQNSYLTSQHVAIRNIVEKLIDTELLAKQSEWKKKVQDIRNIIEKVEANGYKNSELWRSHWDWQLYKVLEYQYIKTLLSLHQHFPQVRVDLVLRGRWVRTYPPIEELRVQHYHILRRFLSLPARFVGLKNSVADTDCIFTTIVDKHSWLGEAAARRAGAALAALERARGAWARRAALASVPDVAALCAARLRQPADWELNFKACKAYGQAVAKMSFEDEKIDWIVVGTATLRREFEAQARNLWATLMSSLQASCRDDAAAVDEFIANATVMLENNALPKNAKELAEISAKQHALQEKMPEMEKTVESLKRKGHMLRTWGGDSSVEGTVKEWHKIRELMTNNQQMFEQQAEIVKASLSGDWENLNTSVEAWLSRWTQTRARFEETHDVSYAEMVDRCRLVFDAHSQWIQFVTDKDDLLKECEKFNMTTNLHETWLKGEKVINEDVHLWSALKDYNQEYESMAEQEWIVFQKKLHLLDEFTSKWSGRLEPYTTVTLYIQQELDKYSDLTPLLKYLRGTDFTERHWREVYNLLEMEYKKPDSLLLKDLLNVAVNIKKNIKDLQKISRSASNEAAVRSALSELELWFAGARLALTYRRDRAGRATPIVQEYKDILAKVEEQQWVVSSLGGGAGGAGGAGGGGGDGGPAWAARLRAARLLLRAASHAQRR